MMMADELQKTGEMKRKLKPASENIWYVMATITGEPKDAFDGQTIKSNLYYWNGYMRSLLSDNEYANLFDADGKKVGLPALNKFQKEQIRLALNDRGFDGQDYPLGEIDFGGSEFPYIDFSEFRFVHPCNFQHAKFTDDVDFNRATFEQGVDFLGSTFLGETYFHRTIFRQGAVFEDAVFMRTGDFNEALFTESVDFQRVIFTSGSDFRNSTFTDSSIFHGTTFSLWANFVDSTFRGRLDFGKARFKTYPPQFFNAKISEDISWTDTVFPKANDLNRQAADFHKDAYERLGLMMDKLNKHHDQHMFFRHEMRARRQMESNPFLKTMNGAYALFSDYGYGFGWAALWWLAHIVMGAGLLMPRKGLGFDFSISGVSEAFQLFGTALVTSFSNAHGFLGLGRIPLKETITNYQNTELLIPFNAIATAQTIIGVFLLFFLILTARNRFRMG